MFYSTHLIGFASASGPGAGLTFTIATGGTITTDGDFRVHTFNSSGDLIITQIGTDPVADALLIAGGGGGGVFGAGGAGLSVMDFG